MPALWTGSDWTCEAAADDVDGTVEWSDVVA